MLLQRKVAPFEVVRRHDICSVAQKDCVCKNKDNATIITCMTSDDTRYQGALVSNDYRLLGCLIIIVSCLWYLSVLQSCTSNFCNVPVTSAASFAETWRAPAGPRIMPKPVDTIGASFDKYPMIR